MSHWHEWSPQEQALAESIYVALEARASSPMEDTQQPPMDMTTLFRCVTHLDEPLPVPLQQQLSQNSKLRKDFHRLLQRCAHYHLPRAAAASSGELTERSIDQFRIRLRPSRVEPDQLYILIDLPEGETVIPHTLFLYDEQGGCLKQTLPPPQGQEIQLLVSSDHRLALGLKDHNTEVFLR